MPNDWKERENLAKIDADIAEAERRVAQQINLIRRMTLKRQETGEATKLLWNYMQALEQWRRHRQLILDEIARQEGPEPEAPPVP
ncbi:hypothetical protein [Microvirga sp. VF16]|uniref:hypothetical protein n=1 Tax=Microvirga sp. VF16 TaxID=2807101 RepID=UPI00193CD480|nr:hypothetical protein [Microvirga sp. VF16]QRM31374.1 hypothetical protein JO965_10515 [Microvirga sp. VF16]